MDTEFKISKCKFNEKINCCSIAYTPGDLARFYKAGVKLPTENCHICAKEIILLHEKLK